MLRAWIASGVQIRIFSVKNNFKQRLLAGEAMIGLWAGLASANAAELCAARGIDWLLIDGEHAPNDVPSILEQLRAVSAYPACPVVRPPMGEAWLIKQLMDIGATSLLVPMVDTAEQARAVVEATRYPPQGIRGVGSSMARASRYGMIRHYTEEANDNVCLLVQVESTLALQNLNSILAVDGVDGVFIGPADLSAAMGHLGNPEHPAVQREIESAIVKISKAGKAPGILTSNRDLAKRYLELGARFVAVGTDGSVLASGISSLVNEFKSFK